MREGDALSQERMGYNAGEFCPVLPFHEVAKKNLSLLFVLPNSLSACTLTFPSQSLSSQMYWEGTQIPCPPNIIIPIQAGAAWKSTFTAH